MRTQNGKIQMSRETHNALVANIESALRFQRLALTADPVAIVRYNAAVASLSGMLDATFSPIHIMTPSDTAHS